ncbi:MAG: peptidoglycan recognition family protein [Enterococcus faecium]|nr:peptidoglycan recognition family protein [Enterococcus faecium]
MKKKIFVGAVVALFLLPVNAFAYTINDEYNLAPNQGDSRLAIPNKIILHETGIDAPARNVAANMKNNYNGSNPYTTDVIGDGGIVYRVGEQGYVSWGAGNANPYAPVQIELQRTYDKALFEKNYRAYIEYTRDSAKKYGIPLTLDQGTSLFTKGIISHLWVTNPTRAGAANPTLTDGTNYAHIDQFGEIENANLHVAGWHIANYKYEYIFIMDYNTGKELARVKADGIYRPDVNQAYGTSGNVGYHVSFNMRNFPNKKVYVMMRATNDPEGNTKGGAQDFHDKRWYLNIPKR